MKLRKLYTVFNKDKNQNQIVTLKELIKNHRSYDISDDMYTLLLEEYRDRYGETEYKLIKKRDLLESKK